MHQFEYPIKHIIKISDEILNLGTTGFRTFIFDLSGTIMLVIIKNGRVFILLLHRLNKMPIHGGIQLKQQ